MQFRVIVVTDPQTHKETHKTTNPPTHRQDRLQYTVPQLARSVIITLRAKLSSAVYCYRSCLFVCVFVWVLWVCLFASLLPRQVEISCIDLHQTGSVGKGSDHLHLIKFWRSCAPVKGVCGGANFWLRLTTASVQC